MRAIFGFCEHLKNTDNTQALQPYMADALQGLITIAQQYSSEVLALCMEVIVIVASVSNSHLLFYHLFLDR